MIALYHNQNRKMINNIVPRSLSEEKARAYHKRPINQLLSLQNENVDPSNLTPSMGKTGAELKDANQYQQNKDFILGINQKSNEVGRNEHEIMKETA